MYYTDLYVNLQRDKQDGRNGATLFPVVYYPLRNGTWLPVNDLIMDLSLCKEWSIPPYEVSGRDPEIWRNVYRNIASIMGYSEFKIDYSELQRTRSKRKK